MTGFRLSLAVALAVVTLTVRQPSAAAETAALQPAQLERAAAFDGYRTLAVTAGVVGGAMVATILTDGLFIPAYLWIAGGSRAVSGVGSIAEAAAAAGRASVGSGHAASVSHAGVQAFRSTVRLLGAIAGGLYADTWYLSASRPPPRDFREPPRYRDTREVPGIPIRYTVPGAATGGPAFGGVPKTGTTLRP